MSFYRFRVVKCFSLVTTIFLIILVYLCVDHKRRYSNNDDNCSGAAWTRDDEIVALRYVLSCCHKYSENVKYIMAEDKFRNTRVYAEFFLGHNLVIVKGSYYVTEKTYLMQMISQSQ